MSDRHSAKGFQLKLSIESVNTAVGGVSKIDWPDSEVQFFDGTSLESGVSVLDGEATGFVTPGSISGELFIDPDDETHQELLGLLSAPAKRTWTIDHPTLDFACTFTGTLKKCQPTGAVGDGLKASFEIKLSAIATYAFT